MMTTLVDQPRAKVGVLSGIRRLLRAVGTAKVRSTAMRSTAPGSAPSRSAGALHSAPGLLAEFVNADRAQDPVPDVFVPVLTVIEGYPPLGYSLRSVRWADIPQL
jgi:hypothetical protein